MLYLLFALIPSVLNVLLKKTNHKSRRKKVLNLSTLRHWGRHEKNPIQTIKLFQLSITYLIRGIPQYIYIFYVFLKLFIYSF